MSSKLYEILYHLIEQIDGERKIKLISYKLGEKLKLELMKGIR